MTDRPIPFSTEMVRRVHDGNKTQTRRLVRMDGIDWLGGAADDRDDPDLWGQEGPDGIWHVLGRGYYDTRHGGNRSVRCPYGLPGDLLYIKEAFFLPVSKDKLRPSECVGASVSYQAAGIQEEHRHRWGRYRHARFMPKFAARIWMEVVSVRVERLQDITEDDARAEGITNGGCLNCGEDEPCGCDSPAPDARDTFCRLWNTINAKRAPWDSNPWVWVIEFRVVRP